MTDWVRLIADRFDKEAARLYFVSDPDGLLAASEVELELRRRGFEVIGYEDPVAFRYIYESRVRPALLTEPGYAVIVDLGEGSDRSVPYDIYLEGRYLTITLGQLVPRLSLQVVREIPKEDLGSLVDLAQRYSGPVLGEVATRNLLLRDLYGVTPSTYGSLEGFVHYLLERHYAGKILPESFDRLIAQLAADLPGLDADPYELLHYPQRFYDWLQSKWDSFVHEAVSGGRYLREQRELYDSPNIRAYLDNLFEDGLLQRVHVERGDLPEWMRHGVLTPRDDPAAKLRELLGKLEAEMPTAGSLPRDWLMFARKWATALSGLIGLEPTDRNQLMASLRRLQSLIEERFYAWMLNHYSGLPMLAAPEVPLMLHQIGGHLQRALEQNQRVALLVLDGLGLDHWQIIKDVQQLQQAGWEMEEWACFAWVPTITPISRQSIFAGRMPMYFDETIGTTSAEKSHWQRFGRDCGLRPSQVVYRHLRLGDALPEADGPGTYLLGVVINDVDELTHASRLGMIGLHEDIRLWASNGRLKSLVSSLVEKGFTVYLTSDHGSVEARGGGQPSEGLLVEQRSARARIYDRVELADRVLTEFPHARRWPAPGLPRHLQVLLADDLTAFVRDGEVIVAHGGVSIEEVIVPLVRIGGRG